jgi:hypothetical protein
MLVSIADQNAKNNAIPWQPLGFYPYQRCQPRGKTTMSPHPHAFAVLPSPPTSRATMSLDRLWRLLADVARTLRAKHAATDRGAWTRGALADLDERTLTDIGASQWHAANAAMRSYEELRIRIDGGHG